MLEQYPEKVKLVFKNFPLANHKFARLAAAAALAADRQGKFWEFHEKLFENYKNLNNTKIHDIAKALGLNVARFDRDLKEPTIQNLIARDMRDGQRIGVRGAPAVFVNGKFLKNRSLVGFQKMIEKELKKGS